jgi:OmcA/MtrC family decaheme c-type cytochrome
MVRKSFLLLGILTLILPLMFLGCGDDGSQGPQGPPGPPGSSAPVVQNLESCVICHNGIIRRDGQTHQDAYNELYQDNVVRVTNVAYTFNVADNTDVVTFNMTKAGLPFDCTEANKSPDSLNIYFTEYDPALRFFQFTPPEERRSIKGDPTIGGSVTSVGGVCTSINPSLDNVDLATLNGLFLVYGRNETLSDKEDDIALRFTRVTQPRYPFAGVLATTAFTADPYLSAANNDGCEKCHTVPYLKHGYIYGEIDHDPATDFYTCKACHLDDGEGGHYEWQLEVNDPPLWATYRGGDGPDLTPAEKLQYAYRTRLMNDVHMSHAMEFPYPQKMSNCVVCHEGKLATQVLIDNNFVGETCLSCHPVDGPAGGTAEFKAPALVTLMPAVVHGTVDTDYIKTASCNTTGCHSAGGNGRVFSDLHNGYDTTIYAEPGIKYSEIFTASIDNASFAGNMLTISFSVTKNDNVTTLTPSDFVPHVMVGLYGWDTKDYYIGPHERTVDSDRNLEFDVGTSHPRLSTVSAGGGSWVVTADLSDWAGIIGDNNIVRRAEIGILPRLVNPALPAGDNVVAMNAPSRTFNLITNAFQPNYYEGTNALVKVEGGCNNCHDALADTFHSPDRGGNIVICRLCHTTASGGSHLEMQSRSIDSYAHAIHSFQPFDINNVDFNNNVEAYTYLEDTRFAFPTLGRTDCEACHMPNKFNVPDQSKSLPGLLSGSEFPIIFNNLEPEFPNGQRQIQVVDAYITGPAARACGGCHRVNWINEDNAVDLLAFYNHTATNGYLILNDGSTDVRTVMEAVEANFYPSP